MDNILPTIAKNTGIQLVGKVISTVLGLVAVSILTRTLGAEQFGWYITATGFLQFAAIISDFGFTLITTKLLAEAIWPRAQLLNTIFTWRILTALLFQGGAVATIIFFPYPPEIKNAVGILAIGFFFLSLNQAFVGYYQAGMRAYVQAIAETIGRVVLVGGVIWCSFNHFGFLSMMIVVAVSATTTSIIFWYRAEPIRISFHYHISRALWVAMWPTALSVIANAVYLQGDRVILPLFVPQTEVGMYGASYRVLEVVMQSATLIMGIMLPLASMAWNKKRTDDFARYANISAILLALVLFPSAGGIIALATPIMRLVAGNNFAPAGHLLLILAFTIPGIFLSMLCGHLALAINRQRQAFGVYALVAVLSTIGYITTIPHYGAVAAAGVSIFSELLTGVLLYTIVFRATHFQIDLFTITKIILATCIMTFAVYVLRTLPLLLVIGMGAILFTFLIYLLRVISPATILTLVHRKIPTPTSSFEL